MSRFAPVALLAAALAFVVGAAVAGVLAASVAPTWQSTAVLDIDQPLLVASSNDSSVLEKLSRLRFKYVGLVGTERIALPVAEALDEDVEQVRDRLGATAEPTDLLLRVTGTAEDPQRARRTADELATVLTDFVEKEQEDDGVPLPQRVRLEIVDVALPAEQIGPARGQIAVIGVLSGALLAGAVLVGAALIGFRDQ